MVICTPQLNAIQLQELEGLAAACKRADGNIIPLYPNLLRQNRSFPCNLLYYQQQQLVGFLSAFFFFEHGCELAMMVAPEVRMQGVATQMLTHLLPLVYENQVENIIFSRAPEVLSNQAVLNRGFCYQYSEYEMSRCSHEPLRVDPALTLRIATPDDIDALCEIDQACFPNESQGMQARFKALLNDPGYSLFVAFVNEALIGKAHIQWLAEGARFTDIAITPSLQGRGFGSNLLAQCINVALTANKFNLMLDVETTKANALRLYTNLGFVITNVCEYWVISIKTLYSRYQFA